MDAPAASEPNLLVDLFGACEKNVQWTRVLNRSFKGFS